MIRDLEKNDLECLEVLYAHKSRNYFQSMTIYDIAKDLNANTKTLYHRLCRLKDAGYIEHGCRVHHAKSYYLTPSGNDFAQIHAIIERKEAV